MLHKLVSIFQVKLFFDVSAISFHSLDADFQVCGDLSRGTTASDEPEDFEFAIREFIYGGRSSVSFALHELSDHARCHAIADVDFAIQDAPDRLDDFVSGFLLHQVAAATGAQHA